MKMGSIDPPPPGFTYSDLSFQKWNIFGNLSHLPQPFCSLLFSNGNFVVIQIHVHSNYRCSIGTEVTSDVTLTCVTNPEETVGQWQDKDNNVVLPNVADKECGCPTLAIAAESGTQLSCTKPVTPTAGFYILDASNTCLLTCDGYYVMSMRCTFPTTASGTQWVKDDDTIIEAEKGCMSCWEGGCADYTPSPEVPYNGELIWT